MEERGDGEGGAPTLVSVSTPIRDWGKPVAGVDTPCILMPVRVEKSVAPEA